MTDKITTYKGFNKDWTCLGFQYEVGKTYTMDGPITACSRGFHGCENPFDVWNHYGITGSKFAICAQPKEATHGGDSKIASASITVEAEIALSDFIAECVDWLCDRSPPAGGYSPRLVDSGYGAQLAASGYSPKLAASGDGAQLAASGDGAQLAASGDGPKLAASGDGAQLAASGDGAQLAASGDGAQLAASGDGAQLAASGRNIVMAASGPGCSAEGVVGTWIALPEYKDGSCVGFATGCIGEDGLKPGVEYIAKNGKLVPK